MANRIALGVAAVALLVASVGCSDRETPEQKLERLRFNHEIVPVGTTTLKPDTDPTLVVDLQIVNQGTERLDTLTVLLRVQGSDGSDRLRERVTLDLSGLRPGVGERRSAMVSGFALAEGDQVSVELEPNLSPEDLRSLPEFAVVAASE